MRKDIVNEEQEYISPLDLLASFEEKEDFKQVLYTFGSEEIVKDNGRYYLCNTKYPNINKEISVKTANEMWQSYNMKTRDDTSLNINYDKNKVNFI